MSGTVLHTKNIFTLMGFSMYDILIEQEKFVYDNNMKKHIVNIDSSELREKWLHPLLSEMTNKIEQLYEVRVNRVRLNLYKNGDKYDDNNDDIFKTKYSSVFIVTTGASRYFSDEYLLEDGDMLYFNGKNHDNIKKSSSEDVKTPSISIIFLVY